MLESKHTSNNLAITQYQKESETKILQAYKDSSQKLELIEQKYSEENQMLKLQLEEALDQINSKSSEIKKLKKNIKNLESVSQVNEVICPKWNISLEDSMIFKKDDMHEVNEDRIKKAEEALQKKSIELDNIFRHLEEKAANERLYQQEIHIKSQQIIQLQKEKYEIGNELKQLRNEKINFSDQLKSLQESVMRLK